MPVLRLRDALVYPTNESFLTIFPQFIVECPYMEVYNELLYNLLEGIFKMQPLLSVKRLRKPKE
jgi:hypothetical protein